MAALIRGHQPGEMNEPLLPIGEAKPHLLTMLCGRTHPHRHTQQDAAPFTLRGSEPRQHNRDCDLLPAHAEHSL